MKSLMTLILILAIASLTALSASAQMRSKGAKFYLDGERLSDSEIEGLIGSDIYHETVEGAQRQVRAGKTLTIMGGVTSLIGATMIAAGSIEDSDSCDSSLLACGYMVAFAGGILLDIGVPLLSIGTSRMKWVAENYNDNQGGQREYSLNFGLQRHGVGLSLTF